MKKISTIILALFMVFSITSTVFAAESSTATQTNLSKEDYTEQANEYADAFLNSIRSEQTISQLGEGKMYPDNYGGCYIDDSGKLMILVVQSDECLSAMSSNKISVLTSLGVEKNFASELSNSINISQVKYSLNELYTALNFLNSSEYASPSVVPGLEGYYLSETNNSIEINIKDLTPEKENLFRTRVFNAPFLNFNSVVPQKIAKQHYPKRLRGFALLRPGSQFGYRGFRLTIV